MKSVSNSDSAVRRDVLAPIIADEEALVKETSSSGEKETKLRPDVLAPIITDYVQAVPECCQMSLGDASNQQSRAYVADFIRENPEASSNSNVAPKDEVKPAESTTVSESKNSGEEKKVGGSNPTDIFHLIMEQISRGRQSEEEGAELLKKDADKASLEVLRNEEKGPLGGEKEKAGEKGKGSLIASLKPILGPLFGLDPKMNGFVELLEKAEAKIDSAEYQGGVMGVIPEIMAAISMLGGGSSRPRDAFKPAPAMFGHGGTAPKKQCNNAYCDDEKACACDPGPGPRKTYVAKNHEEGDRPLRAIRKKQSGVDPLATVKPRLEIINEDWRFRVERTGKNRYLVTYFHHVAIQKKAHSGKEIEKLLRTISKVSDRPLHFSNHWKEDLLACKTLESADVKTIKKTIRYFLALI